MQRKINITKPTILLIASLVIAILVCFSAVFAWIFTQSSAKATISGNVVDFNFTVNGKFNQAVTITSGASISEDRFTYKYQDINGMFPGQEIYAKLYLSNQNSDIGAKYKISLKNTDTNNYPKDCLLEVKDSNGTTILGPKLVSSVTDIFPADGSYQEISTGGSKVLDIIIKWPKDFADFPQGVTVGGITNEDTKTAEDFAFMNRNKDFSLTFEVNAEQVEPAH